ncbi:MAG: FHA domain-containing protein [Xanthomonadales bacterium]|nr:FHA domain-containing protein [Xanthomonadales bacterium]
MPKVVILHQTGPRKGEKDIYSTLQYRSLFIGRSEDCDVVVPDPECVVSRSHALVEWDADSDDITQTLSITDLASANGTFVNSEPIDGVAQLCNGDAVQLGKKVGPVIRIAVIKPKNEAEEGVSEQQMRDAFPEVRDLEAEEERASKPAPGTRVLPVDED